MNSADWTIDTEPYSCDHIDIYNFAKVKEATPLSEVTLTHVSILPYEKPDVDEMNEINSDIQIYERLALIEEQRIQKMVYDVTSENMSKYSFKYDGLITKISELRDDAVELKQKLSDANLPNSSRTFVENESVHITGKFTSNSYAPNQFVFAAQAEHVETGHIDYVDMSHKTNITKKKSVETELVWTPQSPGEYLSLIHI